MEKELRSIFLAKGLSEDIVAVVEAAGDDGPRSLGDLASGAASEADARSWAEELGLSSRVQKSRFVQAWLEAQALLQQRLQAVAEACPAVSRLALAPAPAPAAEPAAERAAAFGSAPLPWSSMRGAASAAAASSLAGSSLTRPGRPAAGVSWPPRLTRPRPSSGVELPPLCCCSEEELIPVAGSAAVGSGTPAFLEQDVAPQARQRDPVVPPRGSPESFSRRGGFSDELVKLLRSCGVTSAELRDLELRLKLRSCQALEAAAETSEEAKWLAHSAGITSRVSQENFALAWRAYAVGIPSFDEPQGYDGEADGGGPDDALAAHGDFYVASHGGARRKEDWVPVLRSSVAELPACQRQKATSLDNVSPEVLAQMAAVYGLEPAEAEAAMSRVRRAAPEDAEEATDAVAAATVGGRPGQPIPPGLHDARTAATLQRMLLHEYRSAEFKAASAALQADWSGRRQPPALEQRLSEIRALCLREVLSMALPEFGLAPDAAGARDMEVAIARHAKTNPEVRELQAEISSVVMAGFEL